MNNRSAFAIVYRRNVIRFHTKTFEACSFQTGQSGVLTGAVSFNLAIVGMGFFCVKYNADAMTSLMINELL